MYYRVVLRALVLCFGASALVAAPAVFAEEGEIEEIVVTGSFIKGTPIDSASPVTVLERDELER